MNMLKEFPDNELFALFFQMRHQKMAVHSRQPEKVDLALSETERF